jgi:hypothetical protein
MGEVELEGQYVPATQTVNVPLNGGQYEPAGHEIGAVLFAGQYVPPPQATGVEVLLKQ